MQPRKRENSQRDELVEDVVRFCFRYSDFFSASFSGNAEDQALIEKWVRDYPEFAKLNADFNSNLQQSASDKIVAKVDGRSPASVYRYIYQRGQADFNQHYETLLENLKKDYKEAINLVERGQPVHLRVLLKNNPSLLEFIANNARIFERFALKWHLEIVTPRNQDYLNENLGEIMASVIPSDRYFSETYTLADYCRSVERNLNNVDASLSFPQYVDSLQKAASKAFDSFMNSTKVRVSSLSVFSKVELEEIAEANANVTRMQHLNDIFAPQPNELEKLVHTNTEQDKSVVPVPQRRTNTQW